MRPIEEIVNESCQIQVARKYGSTNSSNPSSSDLNKCNDHLHSRCRSGYSRMLVRCAIRGFAGRSLGALGHSLVTESVYHRMGPRGDRLQRSPIRSAVRQCPAVLMICEHSIGKCRLPWLLARSTDVRHVHSNFSTDDLRSLTPICKRIESSLSLSLVYITRRQENLLRADRHPTKIIADASEA